MELNNKLLLEAKIELLEETEELKKEMASVIKLPQAGEKQPDLQYFSAIFVSSGTNLNLAHFLPSELVLAAKSVPSKAVDVEHEEEEIIGHIFDYAFTDKEGNKLDLVELSSTEQASLDAQDMHIVIAGVIYKTRFPEIAKEVAENKWKVSMEAYYQDYDLKVGNMILDKKEAEMLGYESSAESLVGKTVRIIKKGVEVASGKAARVLRGICFSGVGIVKNPANPPSVILETAHKKDIKDSSDVVTLNYDLIPEKANNNVTYQDIDRSKEKESQTKETMKEKSELVYNDTVGICVNYKKNVIDSTFQDEDSTVAKTDWCSLYEQSCTSFSRDTTDPECLRNQAKFIISSCISKNTNKVVNDNKRKALLSKLEFSIDKAVNLLED